ncbi:UNVERIFIED_CONTAM: hypothetical protein FKN15_060190 [Acipenser sinensis]
MQPPRATALEDNAVQGSLQASPQAPGQITGVAGARGSARSVLSFGTIGLVALLWICSAKNDGLAGARFGGRVFQPPFPESAGGLRAKLSAGLPVTEAAELSSIVQDQDT